MFFSALNKSVTQAKSLLKVQTYGLSLEIAVCQVARGVDSVCEHFTNMRRGVQVSLLPQNAFNSFAVGEEPGHSQILWLS